jgi:excisionase family DNA binding protein
MSKTPTDVTPVLLLTSRQAARAVALCEKSLYLAVRRGELRAVKFGRAVRYDPADLANWIEQNKSRTTNARDGNVQDQR